jgi:surface protein
MFNGCTALETIDFTGWSGASFINLSMYQMFKNCTSLLDIPLDEWDISAVTDFREMLNGTSIPTARYDATLIAWDALTVQPAETVDFGNSVYTAGGAAAAAKLSLETNDAWIITDGGTA